MSSRYAQVVVALLFFSIKFSTLLIGAPHFLKEQPMQLALHEPDDLGKTHFIVGAPTQTIPLAKDPSPEPIILDAPLSPEKSADKKSTTCALFAPDDDIRAELLKLINAAKDKLFIAVFMVTDKDIANALVAAKKRGVEIELIVDVGCLKDKSSKIPLLSSHGILIYLYNPTTNQRPGGSSLMHHKFALFSNVKGRSIVWTGSYNFTKAASLHNQENVLIIKKQRLFDQFLNQFNRLKHRSYRYARKSVIM